MSGTSPNCPSNGATDRAEQTELQAEETDIVPTIIRAVADVRGEDELSFEPRLYEVIDPDAVEKCVESAKTSMELNFEFASCLVSVTGDGEIHVTES